MTSSCRHRPCASWPTTDRRSGRRAIAGFARTRAADPRRTSPGLDGNRASGLDAFALRFDKAHQAPTETRLEGGPCPVAELENSRGLRADKERLPSLAVCLREGDDMAGPRRPGNWVPGV